MPKKRILPPRSLMQLRIQETKTLIRPRFELPGTGTFIEQLMQYGKNEDGRWWLLSIVHNNNEWAEHSVGRMANLPSYSVRDVMVSWPWDAITPIKLAVEGCDFRTELLAYHPSAVISPSSTIDLTQPITTYVD